MDKITQLSTPDLLDVNGDITDPYRGFIAKSKYNRWLEDEGRRETWKETVDRYVDWIVGVQEKRGVTVRPEDVEDVRHAITYHHVMPSMRALMTAGPAAERNNISIFNCSFLAVDSVRAFDEALIILMHGTGVGFSVENKYVDKLPEVAESFHNTTTVVKVEDSKEGWAKAFKEWLALLWSGQVPTYDVSQVRPKGARLKVFGGRASGPEPLEGLFKFSRDLLINAAGRKITNLEAHDLMCKVAEIVVVGGVRRAALISLSDLGSRDMSEAKSGAWWTNNSQRALANNSAVYLKKPNMETFFREWKSLYDSKSGERGMFNLGAARKHIDTNRRDASKAMGVNPCFSGDTYLMTETGWITFKDAYLKGDPNNIVVDGRVSYEPSEDGVEHPENWKVDSRVKYLPLTMPASPVYLTQKDAQLVKVSTANGISVRSTKDHLFATKRGMVESKDLIPGKDKILVTRGHLPTDSLGSPITRKEIDAVLMGLIAGDGTFFKGKKTQQAFIDLWGEDRDIAPQIMSWLDDLFLEFKDEILPGGTRPFVAYGTHTIESKGKTRIQSSFLAAYLNKYYGFNKETKRVVPSTYIRNAASRPARFYVAALAFADGTVNKYNKVGSSNIRISQNNRNLLEDVQRICLSNGISSSLYSRKPAGVSILPDGRGGSKEYPVKEQFELVFMSSAFEFLTYIGFLGSHKTETARNNITPSQKQNAYTTVTSVVEDGVEDVYCLKEDTRRILSANGLTARRCGEILLRDKEFCNLSEVVARAEDTPETLLEKIRIATIIGTWQASLTDFKYLRKKWKDNTEEEALLGVSITGIYGNSLLNGSQGKDVLQKFLAEGRQLAEDVNEIEARRIGVNKSAAISCVKPSGSVSQLVGTSSGIHPWYAHKYERRVRANNHDPLCQLMKDQGVPWEPEVNKPEDTAVFSFALEAPEGSIVQSDVYAIDHLDLWMTYKKYWTDHNPSVTVTVEEDEWLDVGAYVYKNFDDIVGVSFLPSAGNHTYAQAPFEIVEEDRIRYLKEQVSSVDWSGLSIYEISDTTTGSQELACVAGACEVVDLDEEIEKVEVPTINLDEV